MISPKEKLLLVGDNPFHGISHLSQKRAIARNEKIKLTDHAANLVISSLENGADGFMFSVSDTTLSTLKAVRQKTGEMPLRLFAIVPYAYEYVRLSTELGPVGLVKKLGQKIALSGNSRAILSGLKGVLTVDLEALMKTYLLYELSRIKSSIGKETKIESIMLHEVVTDMALAFKADWLVKSYIEFLNKLKIMPGFETRNFPYLVQKFKEWDVDFSKILVTASFNRVGFQMLPSQSECEKALAELLESNIIAMSILAAGYIKPPEAAEYISSLANLNGVVVGVSKEHHAKTTFMVLKNVLENQKTR